MRRYRATRLNTDGCSDENVILNEDEEDVMFVDEIADSEEDILVENAETEDASVIGVIEE